MTTSAIMTRLTALLADVTGHFDLVVTADMTLSEMPDWDSIKFIETIALIEETFGVDVALTRLDRIARVGDLARLIETT